MTEISGQHQCASLTDLAAADSFGEPVGPLPAQTDRPTEHVIARVHQCAQEVSELAQHPVTGIVAIRVNNALEQVQVRPSCRSINSPVIPGRQPEEPLREGSVRPGGKGQ